MQKLSRVWSTIHVLATFRRRLLMHLRLVVVVTLVSFLLHNMHLLVTMVSIDVVRLIFGVSESNVQLR